MYFHICVQENMECSRMRQFVYVCTHIHFDILNVLIVSGNFKLFQNCFIFISCSSVAAVHNVSHTFLAWCIKYSLYPNKLIRAVTLMTSIQEVIDMNLGKDTDHL
jgi:hypothetical protein